MVQMRHPIGVPSEEVPMPLRSDAGRLPRRNHDQERRGFEHLPALAGVADLLSELLAGVA